MLRLLLVRMLLGLLLVMGLAAMALCVRSFLVGDNASWHARTVRPAAAADAALRGPSPADADWVITTDWIWTSDGGIAELGRLRTDMFTPEADFSGWHYGPGFNYWRLNEMGAPYTWDPPLGTGGGTIGLHYCCVYWFDFVRPTMTTNSGKAAGPWTLRKRAWAVRVPLPLVALIALAWPALHFARWLRRRERRGFAVEPVAAEAPPQE